MIRNVVTLMLLLLSVFALSSHVARAEDRQATQLKHLLVLHSYDPTYPWTADTQQGIEDTLAKYKLRFRLSLEYLDSKRVFNEQYQRSCRHYLADKYANYRFDAIIVTDDSALCMLNSLNLDNFSQLPTVAVGIGDPNATLIPTTKQGSIIHTESHLDENIELIRQLRPDMRNLYYLADTSVSSLFVGYEVRKALKKYPEINLIEIKDLSLEQTRSLLHNAAQEDAVLLGHFNTELDDNIYYEYQNVAQAIGGYSNPPVFVLWEFYISDGVLGGYVTRSYELGVQAVEMVANQVFSFDEDHFDTIDTSVAMFDHQALKQHKISNRLLPDGALVINKPESFWLKNQKMLLLSGGIILILLAIILVQILLLRRKKLINKQNKKIVALQNETLKVQKNLINVLGEAIESRSGETGNHVKRVALISSHLAKLKGLSVEQCDLIETISPMHDVGKISIPEAILDKPGKLNPDEWEIMKSHAYQGYKLLNSSDGDILHYAAIIALEHHERWDGQGYPDGKAAHDIHPYARITTVADVFDALLSARCYKRAWPVDDVVEFFTEQKGAHFDPELTDILLNNLPDFLAIREKYPDC